MDRRTIIRLLIALILGILVGRYVFRPQADEKQALPGKKATPAFRSVRLFNGSVDKIRKVKVEDMDSAPKELEADTGPVDANRVGASDATDKGFKIKGLGLYEHDVSSLQITITLDGGGGPDIELDPVSISVPLPDTIGDVLICLGDDPAPDTWEVTAVCFHETDEANALKMHPIAPVPQSVMKKP